MLNCDYEPNHYCLQQISTVRLVSSDRATYLSFSNSRATSGPDYTLAKTCFGYESISLYAFNNLSLYHT